MKVTPRDLRRVRIAAVIGNLSGKILGRKSETMTPTL
jgi:hypothetical protein